MNVCLERGAITQHFNGYETLLMKSAERDCIVDSSRLQLDSQAMVGADLAELRISTTRWR